MVSGIGGAEGRMGISKHFTRRYHDFWCGVVRRGRADADKERGCFGIWRWLVDGVISPSPAALGCYLPTSRGSGRCAEVDCVPVRQGML